MGEAGGEGGGRKSELTGRKFAHPGVEAAIGALGVAQHAVFSLEQLAAVGLSARAVQKRAARGALHRIRQGVYSLVPAELLTPDGHRMAAVLACGEGAGLSVWAAGAHHGLIVSNRTRFDITVPTRTGHRPRAGIRLHRSTTLRPCDITLVRGVPCTTVARTIFDLAEPMAQRQIERMLDEAEYLEVLDLVQLNEQIEHNRGRPRAARKLERALDEHTPGATRTDGPVGETMLAALRRAGVPEPEVQQWLDLGDGGPLIKPDFMWRRARTLLETDGQRAHGRIRRTESDYERDQRAIAAGWQPLRVTARQVKRDADGFGRTVATVVAARWDGAPAA